jgi:2-C-methyl-D-erythritol 2,4-cyclodiphosphate synthase
MIRVGTAVDIHAFEAGIPLRLGGVTIPHDKGLKGHSDGDALLHAIASALLGSLALGDLGTHFPSSDPELAGIDSRAILQTVVEKVNERGYRLVNLDTMVVAQEPRLSPHVESIRDSVAGCLGVALDCVSVKAATSDRLGYTGRGEGIAAHATVLVARDAASPRAGGA